MELNQREVSSSRAQDMAQKLEQYPVEVLEAVLRILQTRQSEISD